MGAFGPRVAAAARQALETAGTPPSELTLVLTDSRRIRRLNARFAGDDRVTDVLAFPAGPDAPATAPPYLGDVVISLPRARRQARSHQVPLIQELSLLAIHGTLHLLGHDHVKPSDRRDMWRLQKDALGRLGFDPGRLGVDE